MGKTYIGNESGESVIPKTIYVGNSSNLSAICKVAYVGNSSNKAVEVWRNSTIPSAYQKVEYIYNTNGTEYINTGVKPNSNTRILLNFKIVNVTATSLTNYIFGCKQSNADNYAEIEHYSGSGINNYFIYRWGNGYGTKTEEALNKNFTLDVNRNRDGKTYLNNSQLINSTATFATVSNDYLLFAIMQSGSVNISNTIRYNLYYFQAWQGGAMIRNMVPCYLKSDDEQVGMYDLIGGQFYGNSGTGIFYKGPDVN